MSVDFDLTVIWAFVLAFAVFAYVVLDGFDLGVGILFPRFDRDQRALAMNSVAPVWDGNETWLVLGGGGLFAAFPMAFAILMPALYVPIIAMLLALVFRGVAFEFRWRDRGHERWWDRGFAAGSFTAALCQGISLGAILQGVVVDGRSYGGGWFDWLTPFSILTGFAVVSGYGLLGACWLIWKTEGALQEIAGKWARRLGVTTLIFIGLVSLATPFLYLEYWQRWFAWPNVLLTAQVPLLVAITAFAFFRSLKRRREGWPFLLTLILFLLSFIGLGISIWPYAVPDQVTIWDAAAPAKSQIFMLVGAAVLVPLILAYTIWAYWVFRGKVGTHGYHE